MRVCRAILMWHRSIDYLDVELGPMTVFFGKNNSGKTTILEAIYGVLDHASMPGHFAGTSIARGVRGSDDLLPPKGALYVELEPGHPFDDQILMIDAQGEASLVGELQTIDLKPLPANHVAFVGFYDRPGLYFADPQPYFASVHRDAKFVDVDLADEFEDGLVDGPRPRVIFLDWEFADIDEHVTDEIRKLLQTKLGVQPRWLERVDSAQGNAWRVRPIIYELLDRMAALATHLLPDFLDGSIRASFEVPRAWGEPPLVSIGYLERDADQYAHAVIDVGRGAARWIAGAIQIALHVLSNLESLKSEPGQQTFSGNILFVDEPEAHLHPSAVASIVRWCDKMISQGFNLAVASHHEEFLRARGDHVRFVKVGRGLESQHTTARTLLSSAAPLLQELADEVGMHPATLLSLHRAVLYVEGPLDAAMLDEFAGAALEAAGIVVVPIHGTKNLEGLVDGEFPVRLGIKAGILTDATTTSTIWERSNNKRSSEEVKLVRLIKRYEEQGQPPPTLFGVPEADLLFTIPDDAVRDHLKGNFPGWLELVKECRTAEGKGPSDSPGWKTYAESQYGLPLDAAGVRELVHAVDLAGADLPSLRDVVDEIIVWAKTP